MFHARSDPLTAVLRLMPEKSGAGVRRLLK